MMGYSSNVILEWTSPNTPKIEDIFFLWSIRRSPIFGNVIELINLDNKDKLK